MMMDTTMWELSRVRNHIDEGAAFRGIAQRMGLMR